jgi:hypothetical protein
MVKAQALLMEMMPCEEDCVAMAGCPLLVPTRLDQVGLLGVGVKYYPMTQDFIREARTMGISKRIPRLPREFKVGETWVFLSHPKAVVRTAVNQEGVLMEEVPGIFYVFKPKLEYLTDEKDKFDNEKKIERLKKMGAEIVEVPEDDPDHH